MIAFENMSRVKLRSLQTYVLLLFAVAVLPPCIANAQDFDAIERRLGEAIAERELSIEQAAIMLEALRDAAEEDEDDEGDIEGRFGDWVESVGDKLKLAVKEGKLSEEHAWKKWQHFIENELAPKLKATVKSGALSEEAAWGLWKEIATAETKEKGNLDNKSDDESRKLDWESIKRRIETAVDTGKMTREEANKYYKSIKQKIAASGNSQTKTKEPPSRGEIEEVERKIRAAVEEGKLNKEQGRERMEAYLKSLRQNNDSPK